MGIKSITNHLNARNIRTHDGGKFGIASVHQILTRTTYIGQHRFNTRDHKARNAKPEAEHAVMEVPPIVTEAEFEAVRAALKARSPQWMPPRAVSVREPFDPCNEALFAERTADRFGGPQPRECEGVAQARKEAREIGNTIADGRQRRDAVVLACEVGAAARPAPIAYAVDQTRGRIASGRQRMRLSPPKIETLMELRL